VLYPCGTQLPGIVSAAIKIYPGWPVPGILQQDIESGGAHVSVWPLPTERQSSTPLGRPVRVVEKVESGLHVQAIGRFIVVSGSATTPTQVRVMLDGEEYAFCFDAGTTSTSVTSALMKRLPISMSMGDKIYVQGNSPVSVSVSAGARAVRELRRQIKDFQVTVWAPTPQLRNKIGTAVDIALSEQCHIDLGDGAPAQMFYSRQFDSDKAENWHVYRRDLIFSINYATTQTFSAPEVIQTVVTLNGQKAIQ
jgi:hypothetical protein